MTDERRQLGNTGEAMAVDFLIHQGMKILKQQYRNRFGEIDIVAQEGNEIVFVEVKTRMRNKVGYPEDAVTLAKRRTIARVAEVFLSAYKGEQVAWRVDVVAISIGGTPEIYHLKNIDMMGAAW